MKAFQIITMLMFLSMAGYAERISPSNCGWLGCGALPTKEQILDAIKVDPGFHASFESGHTPQLESLQIMIGHQESLLDPILVYVSGFLTSPDPRWVSLINRCGKLEYVDPSTPGAAQVGEIRGQFTWGEMEMCNAPGFPWHDNRDHEPGPRGPGFPPN